MDKNSDYYAALSELKVIEGDISQWKDLADDHFYEIRGPDNVTTYAYIFDSEIGEYFAKAPAMHDTLQDALWAFAKVPGFLAQSCRNKIRRVLKIPLTEVPVSLSMLPVSKALSYDELNKRGVVAHSTPTHKEIVYDRFRYICKRESEDSEWRIMDAEPACVKEMARGLYDSLQRLLAEYLKHFPDANTHPVRNAIASLSKAHGEEVQS